MRQISYSLCLSRSLVGFWRLILMSLACRHQRPIFNTVSLNLNFHFNAFRAKVCHKITSTSEASETACTMEKIWSNNNKICSCILLWNVISFDTEYANLWHKLIHQLQVHVLCTETDSTCNIYNAVTSYKMSLPSSENNSCVRNNSHS